MSGMMQARAAAAIQHEDYPTRSIILTATLATAPVVAVYFALGVMWRFPVPFLPAFAPVPYFIWLVAAHAIVFRGGRLKTDVRSRLLSFIPALFVQSSQLSIYPLYTALFTAANEWQQLLLVLLFPFLKYSLRWCIFQSSRHLRDYAMLGAVSGVEICASVYQSVIMQTTPPPRITAIIIAMDVLVSAFEIRRYLNRPSIVPTATIVTNAVDILQSARKSMSERQLIRQATREGTSFLPSRASSAAVSPALGPTIYDDKAIVVTHALEMFQAAESIVLVEYLEVAVPVVNGLYLIIASQFPSAVYNPQLRPFHHNRGELFPAVANTLLYTLLQGLTLIGMYIVMRVRYRLSGWTLLAFVLETHVWSLQSKLVLWQCVLVSVPIVHYGVDFTFKFDFRTQSSAR